MAPLVRRLTRAGVPVCGHLGLTPQSVHAMGGYRVQGRGEDARARLMRDALALQDAGAFMIVLEMIPAPLAKEVTEALSIPTIGIGAGNSTDGQVLVIYDLLGMNLDFSPKFLKRFANLDDVITEALTTYKREVVERTFPGADQTFEK